MKVVNIHKRTINQPKEKVSQVFKTLATSRDLIWPYENWPAIRFADGLQIGSKGGHSRIRYIIIEFRESESIKFQFTKPDGFNGIHEFKINSKSMDSTEIRHEIRINTSLKATFLWIFVIRWLHDALLEEAFDKVESHFHGANKTTKYNFWVQFLRGFYKRKATQIKHA